MTITEAVAAFEALRRYHDHSDDSWYCCGRCRCPDHGLDDGEWLSDTPCRRGGVCDCGADAANAAIDDAVRRIRSEGVS